MRILITNDDGFLSPGLLLLYRAISTLRDVKVDVVVPEKPQSAGGLAVTLHKPLRVRRVSISGVDMYIVSGKPCDAVIFAFKYLSDRYDLVASGINIGENTSLQAILASGTIAPCIYASLMYNVPTVAFSINTTSIDNISDRSRRLIAALVAETVKFILEHRPYPEPLDVVSVNFPEEIRDDSRVVLCDVSNYKFIHDMLRQVDPRGLDYYWVHGYLVVKPDMKLDTTSLYIGNNIVITGLTFRRVSILREYSQAQIKSAVKYLEDLTTHLDEVLRSSLSSTDNLV